MEMAKVMDLNEKMQLELIAPNNDVYRVIEGEVTLSKEVTRE